MLVLCLSVQSSEQSCKPTLTKQSALSVATHSLQVKKAFELDLAQIACHKPLPCCTKALDLKALAAIPFVDFGPVDFSQGFQCLIRTDLKARCSGVLT